VTKQKTLDSDASREEVKLISCIIMSETSEKELLQALYDEQDIVRANSIHCRGYASLHEVNTKNSLLPQPHFARLIEVIVASKDADEVFDFIFHKLGINKPGAGVMYMTSLAYATIFTCPKSLSGTIVR
jgi:nitrogen regulatory protein PII